METYHHEPGAIGYWGIAPRQRALMDDIESIRGLELMRLGIPRAILLLPTATKPVTPATSPFFVVRDGRYGSKLAFATIEQAEAFSKLAPLDLREEWDTKQKHTAPWSEILIERVDAMTEAEHERLRSVFKANADIEKRNAESKEKYEKARKAEEAALCEVMDDWYAVREEEQRAQKVKATWVEYLANCKGDEAIAATFLAKLYGAQAVFDAFTWLGEPSPVADPATPEPYERKADPVREALAAADDEPGF